MLLQLQKGILYGPVSSRRLGKSLGINLMPGEYKLCSFNCVYCHYGWTEVCTMDLETCANDLPPFDDVVRAVEQAAKSQIDFDFLTFSGNGEPTLYPRFPELVDEVLKVRDKYRPSAKVALLSNSTGLLFREIRECIQKIDLPVFKLDAGTQEKWRAINRPAKGIRFSEIIYILASLNNVYMQTVLVDGSPSNTAEQDIRAYLEKLSRIQPREVHIYSIDRPVPNTQIRLVAPQRLEEIAHRGRKEAGVRIEPFYVQ